MAAACAQHGRSAEQTLLDLAEDIKSSRTHQSLAAGTDLNCSRLRSRAKKSHVPKKFGSLWRALKIILLHESVINNEPTHGIPTSKENLADETNRKKLMDNLKILHKAGVLKENRYFHEMKSVTVDRPWLEELQRTGNY